MDNTVIFLCGRKGSGKSSLGKRIARDAPRVLALDTVGEFREADGATIIDGRDESIRAILAHYKEPKFFLALRAPQTDEMLDIMRMCYEVPDHLLYVEETSWYCTPSQVPDELAQIVRYGRHRRISQLYVARRPSEIHRDLTAQADLVVSFNQSEPRDLAYLQARVGEDVSWIRDPPRGTLEKYRVAVWGDESKIPLAVMEQRQHGGEDRSARTGVRRLRERTDDDLDGDEGVDSSLENTGDNEP